MNLNPAWTQSPLLNNDDQKTLVEYYNLLSESIYDQKTMTDEVKELFGQNLRLKEFLMNKFIIFTTKEKESRDMHVQNFEIIVENPENWFNTVQDPEEFEDSEINNMVIQN